MKNLERNLLGAYLAVMVGMSISLVGQTPTDCGPFPIRLPFMLLVFLLVPALLGYAIGKQDRQK